MPLSHEDNQLLTRVVAPAPMGKMLRENFWFPMGLSYGLKADGAPARVRRIGENFVMFRSTDGRVGVFRENCPHRGTSLTLARNEDNALRCIFHGWKFGVDGKVKEVPTQPTHQKEFCARVPLEAFVTREAGGLVWSWLGSGEPKAFPSFAFTKLTGNHVYPVYQTLNYNWISHIEGQVDSAHLGQLHKSWLVGGGGPRAAVNSSVTADEAPDYEVDDMPGGFRYAAIRNASNAERYVRANAFVAPWYTFIALAEGMCVISVPIDDEHTALFMVSFNADGPIAPGFNAPAENPLDFPPYLTAGPEQYWGQDRGAMMRNSFSGFPKHIIQEDFAVAESQGAIPDRSKEFLNYADKGVVKMRAALLGAVRGYLDGKGDRHTRVEEVPYGDIKAYDKVLSKGEDWRTG